MAKAKDLTGQKFGRLTVQYRGESTNNRVSRWWCKCDCGNPELVLIAKTSLTNGTTRSCGCLQREIASSIRKGYNEYDLTGEYGVGFTTNCDSYGRNEFYFDLEDYDKIKDYCWYFNQKDYVHASDIKGNKRKICQMHQIILPTDGEYVVDHIHGKTTKNDNRKSNLRKVTQSQNAMNAKLRSNNKSGVTGVSYYKKTNKYRVFIQCNGENHYLGSFDNFDDAVRVRKEAEEKYFGEYSYDNSQVM